MTKRGTTDANQMCLPLAEFLAERDARSNAMRPIGEIAAKIVKGAGDRLREEDGDCRPTGREGGDAARFGMGREATRQRPSRASGEVELPALTATGARTGLTPEGAFDHASARAAGHAVGRPGPVFDAQPVIAGALVIMMQIFEGPGHQTDSGTWIEF